MHNRTTIPTCLPAPTTCDGIQVPKVPSRISSRQDFTRVEQQAHNSPNNLVTVKILAQELMDLCAKSNAEV